MLGSGRWMLAIAAIAVVTAVLGTGCKKGKVNPVSCVGNGRWLG